MKTIGFALIIILLSGTAVFASEMSVEQWTQHYQQVIDDMQQHAELVDQGEAPPIKCATPIFLNLQQTQPPGVLLKPLEWERRDDLPYTYATDHFFLHYTDAGTEAIYQFSTQTIEPGVPDYIVQSGRILDSVWNYTVGILGFRAPISDGYYNNGAGGGNGGNGLFDIYFVNTGALRYYGATIGDSIADSIPCYVRTAYMYLDNDYAGFPGYESNPLEAIRVTAAHEFTHACQFALDIQEIESNYPDYSAAWMEMSATAMEEEHYPDINDYIKNYVSFFYGVPSWSLRTGTQSTSGKDILGRDNLTKNFHQYGSAVFPIYLASKFTPQIIADIWNRCGQVRGPNWVSATDASVQQYSSDTLTLFDAFQEFAVWNFFTSPKRARPGYFHDAILLDTVRLAAHVSNYPATVNVPDSLLPDNLGANYIILDNLTGMTSGLTVLLNPDKSQTWGISVVEYNDNVAAPISIRQVRYDSLNPIILIPDAADYNKIALIPEVVGGNGLEVSYSMTITPLSEGVFKPNSGSVLYAGSAYTISWYSELLGDSVELELSRDNGATWQEIAVTNNDFTYNWTVPDQPSTECMIRVSAYPSGDPSLVSGVFSIESTTAEGMVDVYPNPVWMQNYPEMYFRGRYKITGGTPVGDMSVTILTLSGEKVRELQQRDDQQAGVIVAAWDYTNESGKTVAAGPYVALFKFQGETTLKKFVVLR